MCQQEAYVETTECPSAPQQNYMYIVFKNYIFSTDYAYTLSI